MTTRSGEPELRFKLRRIGYLYPIDLGGWINLSAAKGSITAEASLGKLGAFIYPSCEWCGPRPDSVAEAGHLLLPFLDSLRVNYRYDPSSLQQQTRDEDHRGGRQRWREVWMSFPEIRLKWSATGRAGSASVVIRIVENGLALVHILAALESEGPLSAHELIQLEEDPPLIVKPDGSTCAAAEYYFGALRAGCPLHAARKKPANSTTSRMLSAKPAIRQEYQFVYLEGDPSGPKVDDGPEQVYGIIDQDETFENVARETVHRIVADNQGMIKSARNFIQRNRRVVIYQSTAEQAIDGVTGYQPDSLVSRWARLESDIGLKASPTLAATVVAYAPYVDYMMTIEPLLIERALLARYHDQIDEVLQVKEHQNREEIAWLKQTLTNELDLYYSLGSTTFSGVSRAMEHAKQLLEIPRQLDYLTKRLELIEDAVLIYYNTKQEALQRLLSIVFAAFGFGALAETYIIRFELAWSPYTDLYFLSISTAIVAGGMYLLSVMLTGSERLPLLRSRRRARARSLSETSVSDSKTG